MVVYLTPHLQLSEVAWVSGQDNGLRYLVF